MFVNSSYVELAFPSGRCGNIQNMPANRADFRLSNHTIAGIVDAEAHFAITENNGGGSMSCWMAIALRDDDIGLLHALARETRLGVVLKRCADALGRFPGPTEYARWRLHNDPGAPSFGTAYRLFPGGWGELKAACAASA
jgi:hypothetical protein